MSWRKELGARPYIRRIVRLRWAESAKFVAWAASVQDVPPKPSSIARLSLVQRR
jgi:hypothetical protein